MHIDPRLNQINDCLYRVATKAIIVEDDKVLLVQEVPEMWWGFPGGGIDYGESVDSSLIREIKEELGVPAKAITCDFKIAHHTIGDVVGGVPRMNIFFSVSFPKELLEKTDEIAQWGWFTKDDFMKLYMSPSYEDRAKLAEVIFGSDTRA